MTALFITVLVCLAAPLIALQLLVIRGMFIGSGRRSTPASGTPAPSFSVIVPAHNEEARLPTLLASLERQHYAGACEFIVVDDRSTDGTAAVIDSYATRDPRFKRVSVLEPDRRYAPKVNAVMRGLAASSGELIATTDADCELPETWLSTLASEFESGVAMVCGYVEVALPETRAPLWRLIEAADWFSLMLVSRSLLRFGFTFASSANNQAYRRSALEAAGGFGASARAPSADEDLLVQRLGRLPGQRVAFSSAQGLRVKTRSIGGPLRFLRQRSRWVSRYRHVVHYRPGFIAGLAVLGFESLALCAAVLAAPFVLMLGGASVLIPVALAVYAAQVAVHWVGMNIGARQLQRQRLGGLVALVWAMAHPWIIGTAVVWSWVAPGDWRAGAVPYRRSLLKRRLRLLRRTVAPR